MTATLTTYATTTDEAARTITAALTAHGIGARADDPITGPATLTYPLGLEAGTRPEEVGKLASSLAIALHVDAVRITTTRDGVAVEVPREDRQVVSLPTLPDDAPPLAWPVGVDTAGRVVTADLAAAPHVLIAGTTGAGKSTAVHALLSTITGRTTPAQVRTLLVDVKRVELAAYGRTPHAIGPVATDVDAATEALSWAVGEMERRYQLLEQHGARGISQLPAGTLPRLVIVVDELADLMLTSRSVTEPLLVRLAQLGRAAGIHLVLATQRPSADVLTGLLRANVPARLALTVQSHTDSGIALGMSGAETLTMRGDALWLPSGALRPTRVQVPLADAPDLPALPQADQSPPVILTTEDAPAVTERLCCLCRRHAAVYGTSVCISADCSIPSFDAPTPARELVAATMPRRRGFLSRLLRMGR